MLENRERAFGEHIDAIAQHLRPGLTVADGVAIYVTLVLPEIYRTLVCEHAWSPDRYERWLAGELIHQLLRPRRGR